MTRPSPSLLGKRCMVCVGTGFASCVKMLGRICDECQGSGERKAWRP